MFAIKVNASQLSEYETFLEDISDQLLICQDTHRLWLIINFLRDRKVILEIEDCEGLLEHELEKFNGFLKEIFAGTKNVSIILTQKEPSDLYNKLDNEYLQRHEIKMIDKQKEKND